MCIFSGRVENVGSTKIFARLDGDNQFLVYGMNVKADKDVAMILPLPISSHKEDAVEFIDLKEYPNLFVDLEKAFPRPMTKGFSRLIGSKLLGNFLEVHDVGDFIASFVPTQSDFSRLDERFRLPNTVLERFPEYQDYGFAVFQLKPQTNSATIHPMAFKFPTRNKESLFFPTTHCHDGEVHPEEKFDHELYWQYGYTKKFDGYTNKFSGSVRSDSKLDVWVDIEKAKGIVKEDCYGYKIGLHNIRANKDTWV